VRGRGGERERGLTSILEVLLAELLGDVVAVLAEAAGAVAVVVVAAAAAGRPPRRWAGRGRWQEGGPGRGGGAAQGERHGDGARGGGAETAGFVFLLSSTGVRREGRGGDWITGGRMGIDLSPK
jgi:hypothetical protein